MDGTLDLGAATLTTATAPATRGAWEGVVFSATATGSVVDGARIEWATNGIHVDGADVTVRNSEVLEFSGTGIELRNGAGGLFEDNLIDSGQKRWGFELVDSAPTIRGNTVRNMSVGIDLVRSSPQILGNLIEQNNTGIEINNESHPLIASGNVIANNVNRGIQIVGVFTNPSKDPAPVIQGNEIRDNNVHLANRYNLRAQSYGDPTAHIDATGNYWGSVDSADVADWIYDQSDNAGSPTVDFVPYADAAGQPVGGGNILNGTLPADLTLASGTSWQIVGTVTVPAGVTLTIEDGVDVAVVPGAGLLVDGTLDVQGTAGSPVVMHSSEATPTPGAWDGIAIRAPSSGSVLAHAEIHHAHRAVAVEGVAAAVSLSDLTLTGFGRPGAATVGMGILVDSATVHVSGCALSNAGGHADRVVHGIEYRDADGSVAGCTVQDTDQGLHLLRSSPAVQGSTVQGNTTGLRVAGDSAPVIDAGNVITGNEIGIAVAGTWTAGSDPAPVVQGNDVHGNDVGSAGLRNYEAFAFGDPTGSQLDATGNWWGTTDPAAIADGIVDLTDQPTSDRPSVDFTPFLDASVSSGGSAVAGDFLNGILSGATTLSSGTTYDVVGTILVPAGSSLTIPDGATLRMVAGGALRASGSLQVQGTAGSPVLFTSAAATPAAGDWRGILLEAGSGGSVIDHAVIEWASQAVEAHGVDFTLSNSTLRDFGQIGVYAEGATAATSIDANTIRGTTQLGTGIYLVDASPAITGNDVQDTQVGIFMSGASSPVVNGGNTLTANAIGIQLQGGRSAATNPAPVVTGNSLFENRIPQGVLRNVQVSGYFYEGISQVLDFTGNWWGTTTASEILGGFDQSLDFQPTTVDVSDYLDAAGGTPVGGTLLSSLLGNVGHGAASFRPAFGETVSIDFELSRVADVTLRLYPEDDDSLASPVRTITATGLAAGPQSLVWDGKDDAGSFVPDEAYAYTLEATDGVSTGLYSPSRPPLLSGGAAKWAWRSPVVEFNAFENRFWKRDLEVWDDERRFEYRVQEASTGQIVELGELVLPIGIHTLTWDGRDAGGLPVDGQWTIRLHSPTRMKYNQVIVEDVIPTVSGGGAAPTIEVKADPWLVTHSYDQVSTLVFRIDQDATVTVKVLEPGVGDPDAPGAIVLMDAQALAAEDAGGQPLDHEIVWTGWDAADPNAILTPAEGPHTFVIDATSAVTGERTLYRGTIQIQP